MVSAPGAPALAAARRAVAPIWTRDTDSGKRLRCAFCPDCGGRLWHEPESGDAEWLTLKGGSLDQPPDLSHAIHIWTSRKLPGVVIPPGALQFPEEPV